jgi:hypothetical protein
MRVDCSSEWVPMNHLLAVEPISCQLDLVNPVVPGT